MRLFNPFRLRRLRPLEFLTDFARLNRRITLDTPFTVDGPAAGSDLLKTKDDPTGRSILGTLGNDRMLAGEYAAVIEKIHHTRSLAEHHDQLTVWRNFTIEWPDGSLSSTECSYRQVLVYQRQK